MSATISRNDLGCLGCASLDKTAGEMACTLGISFDGPVPQRPPCYAHTTRRTPRLIVVEPTDIENLEHAVSRQIQARSKGEIHAGNCPEIRGNEIAVRMIEKAINSTNQAKALTAITEGLNEAFNEADDPIIQETAKGFGVVIAEVVQKGWEAFNAIHPAPNDDSSEGAEK